MNDFLNRELGVGDIIVMCRPKPGNNGKYADLIVGKVNSFTTKQVRIDFKQPGYEHPALAKFNTILVYPSTVCIIEKASSQNG